MFMSMHAYILNLLPDYGLKCHLYRESLLFISQPTFLTTTLQKSRILIATRSLKIILMFKGDFTRKRDFLKSLSQ